jgi:prepilin-type N-terminal cleavage/methylation domain-containing protein
VLRRGASLVELLVAMALAAVALSAATSTFVRQRRTTDEHTARLRAEAQLNAALGELQAALEGLSVAGGDLAAGQARDTALQLRAVVASGIACETGAGHATLAADDQSDQRAGAVAAAPRAGDTLWWWSERASGWNARRVTDVTTGTIPCPAAGAGAQPVLRLAVPTADTIPRGAPLRLTRRMRFSFYRAADGTWQLGVSDWSDVLHAFAPPQPLAGPLALAAAGARTGFRYFDAGGNELSPGVQGVDPARVVRIRVGVVAPVRMPAGVTAAYRADSVDVVLHDAP